jgi:uncharacterized protein (DUF2342 family)
MLAEMSQGEGWILGCTIVMALASLAAVVIAMVALKSKTETVISPQPFIVAMQKEFATKHDFDLHVAANETAHNNLFSKIGGVERGARQHMDQKLDAMQQAAEAGREKLHDRINEVLAAVSRLDGTVQEMKRD